MRPSIRFFCVLFIVFFFAPMEANAAAWLMEKGKGQLINNFFFYQTDKTYSGSGKKLPISEFAKLEYNPYMEYGWRDDTTLGMSFTLQSLRQKRAGGSDNHEAGLGDIEFFFRHALYKQGQGVVSFQPLVKIPGPYDKKNSLPLGQRQADAELRLLGGISFHMFDKWHYYNAEAAYRKRFDAPSDEIRLDQTLGINIAKRWSVLLQSYHIFSVDAQHSGATFTTNSSDFDLTKLQLSALKELDNGMKVQFGGFSHVDGENTGAGGGVLASLWLNF